jgi:hypothetical protein
MYQGARRENMADIRASSNPPSPRLRRDQAKARLRATAGASPRRGSRVGVGEGCPAGRMQTDFHHGLPGAFVAGHQPSDREWQASSTATERPQDQVRILQTPGEPAAGHDQQALARKGSARTGESVRRWYAAPRYRPRSACGVLLDRDGYFGPLSRADLDCRSATRQNAQWAVGSSWTPREPDARLPAREPDTWDT